MIYSYEVSIVPLTRMALVTAKAKDFEKTILLKMDELASRQFRHTNGNNADSDAAVKNEEMFVSGKIQSKEQYQGFAAFVLSQPIGWVFGSSDTVITNALVFKIMNVAATALIATYRLVLTSNS